MKIHRYLTESQKTSYNTDELGIPIFQDDTCEVALIKIALAIAHKEKDAELAKYLPYAWWDKTPLRFKDFKLPANPWLYNSKDGVKQLVNYENTALFNATSELNVVFYKDLQLKPYFPDVPSYTITSTFDPVQKEAIYLDKLFSPTAVLPPITYTRVMYASSRRVTDLPITHIFNIIRASQFMPFIQLIADEYNIQYKVWKKHSILSSLFAQWTSYERVAKSACLVCMFPLNGTRGAYARLAVDTQGMLTIRFSADAKDNLNLTMVESHVQKIVQYIRNVLQSGKSMKLVQTSVSAKVEIENTTMALNDVAQNMSKLPSLFHILKKPTQDGIIHSVYKRSANYKNKTDITDFISSRIDLGIPIDEIVQDLVDLGMSKDEIEMWIQQYNNKNILVEGQPVPKKVLGNNGSIIKVSKAPFAYKLSIENVATNYELQRAIRWMKGVLDTSVKKPDQPIIKKVATKKNPPPPPKPPSPSPPAIIHEDDALLGESLNFDDMSGGVSDRGKRFFLNRLQKADPALFVDTKNYPRKCAANNYRQPVVISDEEKLAIDAKGYTDGYDNSVRYGSDQAHQNHYICPRVWCPISKIPLTPEKYAKDGCPDPNETAITAFNNPYWENDPAKPHYIGFLKDKAPNGSCLPCCMIKKPKDSKLAECTKPQKAPSPVKQFAKKKIKEPVSIDESVNEFVDEPAKKDNYVMTAPAPIPIGRFGTIPKDMHEFLLPHISWQQYYARNLTVPLYFVRQGIQHGSDSIMAAVATILGKKTKGGFIQDIIKRLSPVAFLSLGFTDAFAPTEAIKPTPGLEKSWKQWASSYPGYVQMASKNDMSRELAIYQAWKNFIAYLESSDPKIPQYVVRLVEVIYNTNILLWHKKDNQSATVQCIGHDNSIADKVAMMIEENGFFEPLELRVKNKTRHTTMQMADFPQLASLIMGCPDAYSDTAIIENIRGLIAWIDTLLTQPDSFRLQTIVLRQDLSIQSIITKTGLIITLPNNVKVRSLAALVRVMQPHLKYIVYHEDIAGHVYEARNIWTQDYGMFMMKLQRLGFGLNGGNGVHAGLAFSSTIRVPDLNITVSPVFLCTASIDNKLDALLNREKRWYQLKLALGKYILQHGIYDKERLLKAKAGFVATNKDMIHALVEEIPLHEGEQGVRTWLYNIDIEERARVLLLSKPVSDKHQFVFSQAAVEEGLPIDVIQPYKSMRPHEVFDYPVTVSGVPKPVSPKALALPKLLTMSNSLKNLPSKFTQIKNYSWTDFKIVNATYTDKSIPELFTYMSNHLQIPLVYDEVLLTRHRIIKGQLKSKEDCEILFNDPSMMAAWSAHFKKKYPKGFDDLWKKELQPLGYSSRLEIWEQIALKANTILKPMEVDLYVLAFLLDISILVIHRSKYGVKAAAKRGDLEDLSVSCTFFTPKHTPWKQRPVCMFFKEQTTTATSFKCIINADKQFFQHVATIPKDIMQLLEHLHQQKRVSYKA